MAGKVILAALRLGLGGLFVFAGAIKIWDFAHGGSATQSFWQDVMNYQMTTSDVAMVIAIYLPWLEVVAGGALLVRRGTAGAALLVVALTLVFMVALGSAWQRGLDISCGCFGHENATANFPLLLSRDAALLGVALVILWWEIKALRRRVRSPIDTRSTQGGGLPENIG